MRRFNRGPLKIWGLKAKTWATMIILVELIIIIMTVGSYANSRIKVAEAQGFAQALPPAPKPFLKDATPEQQQIKAYIKEVFGDQADNAYKVLACENGRLNPNAQGHNTDGSVDTGIFQVNSIHGVPANYLKNWRVNVDVAYQIYKGSGWNAWSCVTMYNSLGREDTVK